MTKKIKITEKDIGRRVSINGVSTIYFLNDKGRIVNIDNEPPPIGIEFDEKNTLFHSCDDECKDGHGWYVTEDMITFIDKKEKEMKKQNNSNTGIRIEAQKVIMNSGDFGYKITNVKALERKKLPWMYLKEEPNVYFKKNGAFPKYLVLCNGMEIVVGFTYTKHEFEKRIEYCRKAGNRLMEINKKIKELEKQWNGKETIII